MLKQNAGISFLPEFAVRHEVESGILSILPVKDFHMELYRQVLYHKDKWHTGEMDAFIELAKETFRTSPVSDEHNKHCSAHPDGQPVIPCYVIECSKPHVERGAEKRSHHGGVGVRRAVCLALPEDPAE